MNVALSIYYHIKSHPPEMFTFTKFKSVYTQKDFSRVSYPHYKEEIKNVELCPKYMFLIYYTYRIVYEK